ncbi:hypothetical protein [Ureibacillus aquaedulcis]|uniref:Helix-turn-helix domain-containing protein n=1 Tax=Ureibacillus aquaedulcis TaxID=3058421 RepID=A0ABT8GUN2_9BACL|nr:hypothetical protein [Ureibacillus sp. BA0131]MDN4495122.1 hypothetical protein [Ureibacillus sp. BA0131]
MNEKNITELPINSSIEEAQDYLLINEPTVNLYPTLAVALGINEALILAKLDSLLETSSVSKEGHIWCKHTYHQWHTHFPFRCKKTIERAIRKLEKHGYIISITTFENGLMDKTKWYRIDYDKMQQLA